MSMEKIYKMGQEFYGVGAGGFTGDGGNWRNWVVLLLHREPSRHIWNL